MIKAVGFDLFGTLVQKPKKFREDPSYRLYTFLKQNTGFNQTFKAFGTILLTRNFSNTREICDFFDIKIPTKDIAYFDELFLEDVSQTTLIPGTIELLDYTKSKVRTIFLISNLSTPYGQVIDRLGIKDRFNFVLYSYEELKTKPNVLIFFRAIIKLGMTPENVIFTGDSMNNDVAASCDLGMQGILISEYREKFKEILSQS